MTDHLQLDLEKLNACIHCGMCLPVCPTYRVTGSEAESPRGRLYLIKKTLQQELDEPQLLRKHLDQCLACHACETACPSGVHYGDLLFATREQLVQGDDSFKRKFKRFAFQHIFPNHGLLSLGAFFLKAYQLTGLQAIVRSLGILKSYPTLDAQERLLAPIHSDKDLKPGMTFGDPNGELVCLMTGCIMDVLMRPIHWATIHVLTANGYRVIIPEQTCCGALAHHAGETDITRDLAKQNIQSVLKSNPTWIVINSAGCGSTMQHYEKLLAGDSQAVEFSSKVIDVMDLLSNRLLAPMTKPQDVTVSYHAACHLYHVQGVKNQVPELLAQVPGIKLVPLPEAEMCCGSAGIYNIEQPALADDILDLKMISIRQVIADNAVSTIVTGNPGCLMQLQKGLRESGLSVRLTHPVVLLAQAYGWEGKA